MWIVVEGVDGSGKSTLVDELALLMPNDTDVLHKGPLTRHPLEEYEWAMRDYDCENGPSVISDRWHVGELIYGPLYRGESRLTAAMARHVELFIQSRGGLRVWMNTPFNVVEQRLKVRGEDFLQPQHARLVHAHYAEYCAREGWYEVAAPEVKAKQLRDILKKAETAASEAKILRRFPSYVGPLKPDLLILGEKRSTGQQSQMRPHYTSCFVPYENTSGHYLLTALESQGSDLTYGIANALEEKIPDLWETLGRPKVVALGRQAYTACYDSGVRSAHVAHPQYVRRFMHGTVMDYGREIIRSTRYL